ncbi:PepSY-associated TM helix domain-containing protein [Jatrophihabitans endophyticus]|uniref:PepSY-associated TM helix domain-containing protein n=1 Tax=Jatrophihabitans endophyticus TaxID=1206085 RepID=UPI0026EB4668|nr:PepSY-associated TM helix domain-containing protein [Jatrophihabitans endophyticus]
MRSWWRKRPVRRAMLLAHRWPGIVLGLLLVIECTTGAMLLYRTEIFRATHSGLYQHTAAAHPLTPAQAIADVRRAHPGFGASWVARDNGVYAVGEPTYARQWFVDPGTGHLNGLRDANRGFFALLENVHDCGLTCAGEPLYSSWMATDVWDGGPTMFTGITRGGLILGVLGLSAVVLVATSLRIWWPGRRRLRSRFVVRRGRGRFARDFDLHNVIGAIGLPFLLMWGVTGAALEFPVVENVWVTITGGSVGAAPAYSVTPNPATAKDPRITAAAATDAALRAAPGRAAFVGLPSRGADYYEIDVISGYASDAHRLIYSGDEYVYVDAHDASNLAVFDGGSGPAANRFYDKFLEPTHFGWNVNAWWRAIWFVLGLAPLALFVTGISTWLFRREVRRRRRRAVAA